MINYTARNLDYKLFTTFTIYSSLLLWDHAS